ncbi:MAG: nucleotidyltransferase family protein [Nitrospirae bacterium]|nr:nucleotidyltransferase family protein [Nitrospirota bacterium]
MAGPKRSDRNGKRRLGAFLNVLRRHLPELRKRYRVRSLGIFGSYVSGAPRKGSDLDVLVEFLEEPSLFEFMELEAFLSEVIGVKVDLVMRSALKPRIGRQILSEVVSL